MPRRNIPESLRHQIAEDARHRCGYCLTAQQVSGAQMHVEHLVPLAAGGASVRENLWLACAWRNSYNSTRKRG